MINKDNGIPYYLQLANIIEEKIELKLWPAGEQIASETELSQICGLNRHTVRQAVDYLCNRGVLYKLKGRGTFVAQPQIDFLEYKLSSRNKFSENIYQAGKTPRNCLLKCERSPAPRHVANALLIPEGEEVFEFAMLRKVDGMPFLLAVYYVPVELLPGLDKYLPAMHSLFDIYHHQYNLQPRRVKTIFRTGYPREEEIRILNILPSTPVLRVDSTHEAGGLFIQYTEACYRGDMAKLSVEWDEGPADISKNDMVVKNPNILTSV